LYAACVPEAAAPAIVPPVARITTLAFFACAYERWAPAVKATATHITCIF
jgi:hypothetical protein